MKNLIPKTSTPLAKFIRTTEGWLIIIFNVVVGAAATFGTLPGVQAVKYAAIANSAAVFARSGLKAIASFSQASGLKPIEPNNTPVELAGLPDDNDNPEAVLSDKPQSSVQPDPGSEPTDPPPSVDPKTSRASWR